MFMMGQNRQKSQLMFTVQGIPGDSRIACEAEFEHYQQIEDAEREKKRKLKSEATGCDRAMIK